MTSRRQRKVARLLQSEIAIFCSEKLDLGVFTVTGVEPSPDLREAQVWYSLLGGDPAATQTSLDRLLPELTLYLRRRLELKYIPKLRFVLDHGLTHQAAIEARLKDL